MTFLNHLSSRLWVGLSRLDPTFRCDCGLNKAARIGALFPDLMRADNPHQYTHATHCKVKDDLLSDLQQSTPTNEGTK